MIGNLAPLGTGSFDLRIDPECIAQNVQTLNFQVFEEEGMDGGQTPIAINEADELIGLTPMAANTPYVRGGATSAYMTPGQSEYIAGSFSP
jgi:hypothetical protein